MMFAQHPSPARRARRPLLTWLAAAACAVSVSLFAQVPTDLTGARFAPNCGAANATQIFADGFLASGQAGINDMQIVSDPDVVLIGNQWWLIFASNPGPSRGIEPVAAYLPPGVSLSYTGVYPADPNGWHLIGAKADGTGKGVAIAGTPSPAGWDNIAAETPSIDVGPDGTVTVYYAGHNLGQTNFEIGRMPNVVNGVSPGEDPVPSMLAVEPWEYADGLGAILEQSVRWHPELNKFIMYYTAGAWWDQPPTNDIAYAESTDGITWTNRQHLGFPKSYYNQDFLYNEQRNRYEMVIANDPTGVGGGNGRDLVWLDSATPGTHFSDWQNQVTLLDHTSAGTPTWRDQGLLSPAIKYGNLPGEENRLYVFFHAYGSADPLSISRFYCDAIVTDPGFKIASAEPFLNLAPGAGGTLPISISPINGFNGTVNVSISGGPAGSSATYLASSPTAGTLVLAVAANTPQGRYPVTVTGTSGNITQTTTFTLNVSGQDQTITIQPLTPNNITYTPGLVYTVNATASSGLPVTLRVGGNGTLNGNVLTVTGGGNIIISADQGGNGTYNPAPEATTTLVIAPETQTVNVAPIPAQTYGGTLDLGQYISTSSGLTGYTYVGVSPTVCTNNGSAITFVGAGTCAVIVIQFGNSDYAPAGVAAYIQVNPAVLKVSANNLTGTAGQPLPPLTYNLSGFIKGDSAAVVTGAAALSTTATPTSPPGVYPISVAAGTLAAANYTFTFIGGTLTEQPGTLLIAPVAGDFGSIALGKTSPVISFSVTNYTASTMGYLGYANLGEFYLQPGTCHLVAGEPMLKPGQSCVFTAVFKPTKAGPVSGQLSIKTPSGTFTVPLSGTGATLAITPAFGNFGSVGEGKTSPAISFTVTNDTASTTGYLDYTNLGEFYLQAGTCHLAGGEAMLSPGQSCSFTAVFKPTKPGPASGYLSIGTSSGTYKVPMTGTGTPPAS